MRTMRVLCLLLCLSGSLQLVVGYGGESPTPFPRKEEAFTRPINPAAAVPVQVVGLGDVLEVYGRTMWVTRTADGRVVFHDCADAVLMEHAFQDLTWDARRLAEHVVLLGPEMQPLLGAVKRAVAAAPAGLSREELTEMYRAAAVAELEAVMAIELRERLSIATMDAGFELGEGMVRVESEQMLEVVHRQCDTGRCDCAACTPRYTCDCEQIDWEVFDCFPPRASCSVEIAPDPKKRIAADGR